MRVPLLHRSLAIIVAATLPMTPAATESPRPLDPGLVEKEEVNLVIVDVQALDKKGNPVSGLVREDFDVKVAGVSTPIVSFDATCSERPEAPDIVLAFDYQHLNEMQRGDALESARRAVERVGGGDAEIMIAALTGGLRVEQQFTKERGRVPAVLRAMRDDPTLFAGNFSHMSEDGFVRGLTSLFDVLAVVPKPKAVLLYSAMKDVPLDEQFRSLAAMAAASRSVIYPVDVRGLGQSGPSATERRNRTATSGDRAGGPVARVGGLPSAAEDGFGIPPKADANTAISEGSPG